MTAGELLGEDVSVFLSALSLKKLTKSFVMREKGEFGVKDSLGSGRAFLQNSRKSDFILQL